MCVRCGPLIRHSSADDAEYCISQLTRYTSANEIGVTKKRGLGALLRCIHRRNLAHPLLRRGALAKEL